jgi:hypothetical protein
MVSKNRIRAPVHLRFDDGVVYIVPSDSKRFRMAARRAVGALRERAELDQMIRRFEQEYLPRLYAWCNEHRSQIASCYLWVPTHHGLTVLVVGASGKYDFELGRIISDFALQLEEQKWPSNILQIVAREPEDLLTYFDPGASLQVYGQTAAAPRQS